MLKFSQWEKINEGAPNSDVEYQVTSSNAAPELMRKLTDAYLEFIQNSNIDMDPGDTDHVNGLTLGLKELAGEAINNLDLDSLLG